MTLLDLRTLVLTWLDDPNAGYFTTSQVNQWINNAQKETQKILIQAGENWYVKCAETPVFMSQCAYALPGDFLKTHRVELVTGGTAPNETKFTLESITIQQQDLFNMQVGQPRAYFLKKDRMVIFPVADADYQALRMSYSYRVLDMALDTEVPDVPEQYHEFLAVLATLDGLYKDGRDPTPMMAKKQYYEALFKQDAEERTDDGAKSIVITQSYSSGEEW